MKGCRGAGETAIRLAGEFTWDEGAAASLVDIDLSIPAGALVAVVGQTGSGKSSLLGAALGLMKQVQGPLVEVHGKARTGPCDRWSNRVGLAPGVMSSLGCSAPGCSRVYSQRTPVWATRKLPMHALA